jgi:DNA-binding PadR family transcriptional regulator
MSIRHALLSLLAEGPKYGLRLREEFEARTGELWPLNVGQVYTTLQRLERDALIESDDDQEVERSSQKRYRLTQAGRYELMGWLHAPSGVNPPPRDELVIKVMVALKVPGVDVHEILQVHRRHLVENMQRYTTLKSQASPDDLGLALVVDAELFRLDAAFRWIEGAETRLRQSARRDGARQDPGPGAAGPDQAPSRPDVEVPR